MGAGDVSGSFYVKTGAHYAPVRGRLLFRLTTPDRAAALRFNSEGVAQSFAHLLRLEAAAGEVDFGADANVVEIVNGQEVRCEPPTVQEGAAPEVEA
jgi:hypothetical protein